jgi:subtilisin family serine protease
MLVRLIICLKCIEFCIRAGIHGRFLRGDHDMQASSMRQRWLIAITLCLIFVTPTAFAHPDRAPQADDFVANEVLVKLNPAVDVRALAARYHLKQPQASGGQFGQNPIYRLQIDDGVSPKEKANLLRRDRRVVYAEPNYIGALPEARQRSSWVVGSNAGDYTEQWAPTALRLPEAHTLSRGAGVIVAILDTGVDSAHPALVGRLVPGYDFVDLDNDPSEVPDYDYNSAYGHGTHVAGLVALAAPDAQIMALRTLDRDGIGTIWMQAQALRYAFEHGADVINLSYSFGNHSELLDDILAQVTCTVAFDVGCRSRTSPGALVAAAAGNSGVNVREYPAADLVPGVLAVAASTEASALAPFSTYGSWVPVAAPGDRIVSSIPGGGYAAWSGTSMATPLAAGVAALARAAYPTLRPVEVQNRMTTNAATLNGPVRRRIDAAATLGLPTTRQGH